MTELSAVNSKCTFECIYIISLTTKMFYCSQTSPEDKQQTRILHKVPTPKVYLNRGYLTLSISVSQ